MRTLAQWLFPEPGRPTIMITWQMGEEQTERQGETFNCMFLSSIMLTIELKPFFRCYSFSIIYSPCMDVYERVTTQPSFLPVTLVYSVYEITMWMDLIMTVLHRTAQQSNR